MAKISLKLQKRETLGRKNKALRREGLLPANIYGKKVESVAVQLPLKEFAKLYNTAGETNIVYISLDSETKERPCLISHVQNNPVGGEPIHVDFHQVDLSEKVTADIPVEIIGESPAVKAENASIITQLANIEVEALPADLPEKFEVDISQIKKVGDSLKVSDLKYDKDKVSLNADPETIIVSAQAQAEEEPEPEAVPAEGEAGEAAETKEAEAKPEAGEAKSEAGEANPEAKK